jgi:hypothetical protein
MTEFFDHRNRESIPMCARWHASYGDFRPRVAPISGFVGDFHFSKSRQKRGGVLGLPSIFIVTHREAIIA